MKQILSLAGVLTVLLGATARPIVVEHFASELMACKFREALHGSLTVGCALVNIAFEGGLVAVIVGTMLAVGAGLSALLDRTGSSNAVHIAPTEGYARIPPESAARLDRLFAEGVLLGVEYTEARTALALEAAVQSRGADLAVAPMRPPEPISMPLAPQAASPVGKPRARIVVALGAAGAVAALAIALVSVVNRLGFAQNETASSPLPGTTRYDSASPAADAASPSATAEAGAPPTTQDGRPEGFPEEVPRTRTRPPSVGEWARAPTVKLEPEGCFRKVVREWMKLNCSKDKDRNPGVVALRVGPSFGNENSDYFVWVKAPDVADLVLRMVAGRRVIGSLELETRTLTIGYDWSGAGEFPKPVWDQTTAAP